MNPDADTHDRGYLGTCSFVLIAYWPDYSKVTYLPWLREVR